VRAQPVVRVGEVQGRQLLDALDPIGDRVDMNVQDPGGLLEAFALVQVNGQGPVDIVLICPDDPDAMLRHTQACRDRAVPFAADPSQQIARMDGTNLLRLVDGAR
jgi:hypothetical protein